MTDEQKKVMAKLLTGVEINGVSVARVKDGHVYMFTRSKLEEFLDICGKTGEDKLLIYVRSGGSTTDESQVN